MKQPEFIKDAGRKISSGQVKKLGMFKCECGKKFITVVWNVYYGVTKSCGCHKHKILMDRNVTHGLTKTPEYRVWKNMRRRVFSETSKNYRYYKAKGIKVCERWESFENFIKDMGKRPTSKHSIDRIDSNGNYEPSNCRWATALQQNRNRSNSVWKKRMMV